jgi:multiple sugar transport system permease protein
VRSPAFVGLDNFSELLDDDVFGIALVNSLTFAAAAVPLRVLAALGLALLLHRRFRGVGAARSAVLLPTVVPEIAYGLLWLWLLNPLYGPVNVLLTTGGESGLTVFGRLPPQWLTDPNHARAGIVLLSLFTIGEGFVLLLVARQAVPADLYELAALEDATPWDVFRRVTLPFMAPVLALLFLRDTILSFTFSFVPALVVTEGGPPSYGTTYLSLFVYREGFEYLRYGYAAAATVVLFVLTASVVLAQVLLLRRWRLRVVGA